MEELVQQRTLHSKTFDLGGDQRRLVSRRDPMHYDNNGVFEDVDVSIVN